MMKVNIKETLRQYWRVLKIARKPDKSEFSLASKVTGAGMLLIGLLGFIVFAIYEILVGI